MKMYQIILIAFLGLCFTACDPHTMAELAKALSPAEEITGEWNVEMTMTLSDCHRSPRNETFTERWYITHLGGGRIEVQTQGSSTGFRVYKGEFTGNGFRAHAETNNALAKIGLNIKSSTLMEGTRNVEMGRNRCETAYQLRLTRGSSHRITP